MQDAVLTTLGREMGAYAEALNRDRWRIYKCEERLRVVNLGGTAIGTGLAAPRAVHLPRRRHAARAHRHRLRPRREPRRGHAERRRLRRGLAASSRRCAATLLKVCGDLRLLSLRARGRARRDPPAARQAGSSIMPGKVNPVIPEAVSQAALLVMGYDADHRHAPPASAASSSTRSCRSSPTACCESLRLLARACEILRRLCVEGIEADEARCRAHVRRLDAPRPRRWCRRSATRRPATSRAARQDDGRDDPRRRRRRRPAHAPSQFDELLTAEAVCRLGTPQTLGRGVED